jgi:hypothetical protein
MPTVIRNQKFALLKVDKSLRNEQGHALYYPTAIDARDEDEARMMARARIESLPNKGQGTEHVLIELLCDYSGVDVERIYAEKE